MRSLSTGRKIEVLNITVPGGSTGTVKWGGKSHVIPTVVSTDFCWYRYLDAMIEAEKEWQPWSMEDVINFVDDDTWVKPEVEERPEGVMDWEALEENYLLAGQRFKPFGANAKPGGRNKEEDLRMQLDMLEQAERKGKEELKKRGDGKHI
jgi:hypothetical protein